MAYSAICSRATEKSKLDTKGAACQICPRHLDLNILGYSALATPARSRYAKKAEARDGRLQYTASFILRGTPCFRGTGWLSVQ